MTVMNVVIFKRLAGSSDDPHHRRFIAQNRSNDNAEIVAPTIRKLFDELWPNISDTLRKEQSGDTCIVTFDFTPRIVITRGSSKDDAVCTREIPLHIDEQTHFWSCLPNLEVD